MNVGSVISNGDYQPIAILPGRTSEIIVPIRDLRAGGISQARELRVGVYDLPTRVDAASNPTKRQNFEFAFVRR